MDNDLQKLKEWAAETFVGKNYDYYKSKWQYKEPFHNFSSWNWVAFLFPLYWMAYRKMYLEAFLLILASIPVFLLSFILPFAILGLRILIGTLGNSLYYRKAYRIVKRTSFMADEESRIYIKKRGGTSPLSLALTIVAVIVISSALAAAAILYSNGTDESPSEELQTVVSQIAGSKEPRLTTEKTHQVTTKTGDITYTVPTDFVMEDSPDQDLYCYSESRDLGISVIVYQQQDFSEKMTEQSILDMQVEDMQKTYKLAPLADAEYPDLDQRFAQKMYSSSYDGMNIYLHLSCQKMKDRFAVTIISTLPSNWSHTRALYGDIIKGAALTEQA